MRFSLAAPVMIVIAATAVPLCAQVLEAPPRVGGTPRPVGATRVRHDLRTQFNVMGGFDDNLQPGEPGLSGFENRESGYMGFSDAALRYQVEKGGQSFHFNTRGFMSTYRSVGLGPSYGGDANTGARATLGRTMIDFTQTVDYEPYFTVGAFGALSGELGAASPDASTANAITRDRSLSVASSGHIGREWNRRLTTDLTYTYQQRSFLEGANFDTRGQAVSAAIGHTVFRRGRVRSSYTYSDSDFQVADGSLTPMKSQQIELGYEHRRDLSRTRSLSFSGGAGGTHVDTLDSETRLPIRYWSPTGYGSIRYDFGRTWNLSGDYRRTVSALQGLSPVFYNSDTATIRTGGEISERVSSVFIFGYVNGQAGVGSEGRYDGYTGSGQLRFALTRFWALAVLYNHYQYRLSPEASISLNVAPELHRNTIMVGFNFNLPLVTPRGGDIVN
jgi:hypothetical protein